MKNSAEHHGAGKADTPRTQTLPTSGGHGSSAVQVHDFYPDRLDNGRTVVSIVLAAVGAFVFTLVSWLVLKQTSLPAFGSSMVTRALASATIVVVLMILGVLMWLWIRDEHFASSRQNGGVLQKVPRPMWRRVLTYLVAYLSPAALVVAVLAIPLSATRLYLDGISVDQGFRTQYLTRLADDIAITDMNYVDIPTYYPPLWFWFGGRLANLLDIPGWEVFQPWSIISLAIGGAVLVPVWQRLVGSLPVATGIAIVTTCVILVMSPDEPYAALVAMGIPAMVALTPGILRGKKFALIGGILFLGFSATFYTLFTAAIALSVVVVTAVVFLTLKRSWKPVVWLTVLGVASISIALITWGPFLLASAGGAEQSGDTAMHYLPMEGTQLPLPFLAPSMLGLLSIIGLVYLVVRRSDPVVQSMQIALIVFYGWIIASMMSTLLGSTLLGFRLDTLVVLMLTTAGVLGIADFLLAGIYMLYPNRITPRVASNTTTILIVLVLAGGLNYAQNIPQRNAHAIDLAYTDTDGYGERADLYPAGSAQYYGEIDAHLQEEGFHPSDTIVLTDELNFMSYNPYRGFQAFTSHYANPLGEFGKRNATIEGWAVESWDELSDPADFAAAIDGSEWAGPEVFILRGDAEDVGRGDEGQGAAGWKYDLAEDIYPNNPNVRFRGVFFNPQVFVADGAPWQVEQIGPFVVVTRDE
ncbi:Arabinofuranosyltransferase AftA [Corynebacterium faecale]|uniref:galactan 5-O-arabinofuranosyltransferase n=1 Tax=Corynebacterium faecale TaxID=1758466 RepID=UPI0025B5BDBC|nr:galactan 5-O-arabinofuranosyltransferase [Corynebacterium faecale]WJY91015.1 Arabinofuranosyltransferase AftA [Corynebacterium faecale]